MLAKIFYFCCAFLFIFYLMGCTTVKKKDLEAQGLKNQVQVLQMQLQDKDQEIMNLREAFDNERKEKDLLNKKLTTMQIRKEAKSPNTKQIQIALKNAGYDPGPIDGKMGAKTREAIKAFQQANGLIPDGKVGKLTWNILLNYLSEKNK